MATATAWFQYTISQRMIINQCTYNCCKFHSANCFRRHNGSAWIGIKRCQCSKPAACRACTCSIWGHKLCAPICNFRVQISSTKAIPIQGPPISFSCPCWLKGKHESLLSQHGREVLKVLWMNSYKPNQAKMYELIILQDTKFCVTPN